MLRAWRAHARPADHAVLHPIKRVDRETDHEPHSKADPGVERQAERQKQRRSRSRGRNEINRRCLERAYQARLSEPQREHAEAHDREREQCADADQLAHEPDRQQSGQRRHDGSGHHGGDVRRVKAWVHLGRTSSPLMVLHSLSAIRALATGIRHQMPVGQSGGTVLLADRRLHNEHWFGIF